MKILMVLFALILGAVVGVVSAPYLDAHFNLSSMNGMSDHSDMTSDSESGDSDSDSHSVSDKNEPLYWVAPMDPNYQRDKPGKSPMGMDLIPVYANDASSDDSPGSVSISPEVVNNLGVRTAQAELRQLSTKIQTVGYVQYNQDTLVHIHPRVEGWVEELHVTAEGDPVKKGQPLYAIYSQALINAQEEVLLALNQKSERLKNASLRKLRLLHVPEQSIKRLLRTRTIQERITFYAPQSGVLDNLEIREGYYVKPENTLMSIGALDEVWLEAEVFEQQAGLVTLNAPVTMTLDYFPGRSWQGQVDYIYPSLDAMTRTLKVRIRFPNNDFVLKPNMFASVEIHAEADESHVMIPHEAVIRTADQNRVVLALDEGSFKSIAVTLGQGDQHYVRVLDGLNAGERIVTSAQFLLDSESSKTSDFMRMEAREANQGGNQSGQMSSVGKEASEGESAWVEATIQSIEQMGDSVMIGADHQPVDAWGWPQMYMDFPVVDSVDTRALHEGMTLHIEITKYPDHSYEISNIHVMDMNKGADQGGN